MTKRQTPAQEKRRKRKTNAMMPPVAAADGVARVAGSALGARFHSRRGPVVRARRMVAAGVSTESAAEAMAKVAKGYVAEAQLAASVSARSGLVGSNVGAYPNRNAFDPTDDIILTQAGIRIRCSPGQEWAAGLHPETGRVRQVHQHRGKPRRVEGLERIEGLAKGQFSRASTTQVSGALSSLPLRRIRKRRTFWCQRCRSRHIVNTSWRSPVR